MGLREIHRAFPQSYPQLLWISVFAEFSCIALPIKTRFHAYNARMKQRFLRVAVPAPIPGTFDYLPPQGKGVDTCVPGVRVRVPFGRGQRIGVVLQIVDTSEVPRERLKPVDAVLDQQALLAEADLDFLRWVATYYHHPLGEVVSAALPLRLRKQADPLPVLQTFVHLAAAASDLDAAVRRAPKQRSIIEFLQANEGVARRDVLRSCIDGADQPLAKLLEKGVLRLEEVLPQQALYQPLRERPHQLNNQQQMAVQRVADDLGNYAAFLLNGVTGSGKTEVYLQLAEQVLQRGETVMILVPEISLTPQLAQRFAERLGGPVTVMHSAMNDSEREQAWQQVRLGLSRLVLGTRSLVLYPIDRLGLILVDEEHDTSFKQQEGFRYSARDLAVVRARRAGCPVVLGSATPSLESLLNVKRGRYHELLLSERAGDASSPVIHLLDTRDQPLQSGLSTPLLKALGDTLDAGEQAMVFINRRGYAPVLTCYSCGWMSDCPRCDARQTLHRRAHLLWCHHCGSQRPEPQRCPECGATDLHPLGQGTEQLETILAAQFPQVPIIRVDRDATARKGSLDKLLKQIHDTDSAILVGTQMLAKGHHFPRVTLVGVLDADGGLFSADFRATERMAQLLLQVAGRSGRGDRAGRVLVQTRFPDHPLMQTLVKQGFAAFAEEALHEREEAEYPPFTHQALLRAEAGKADQPLAFLHAVTRLCRALDDQGVELWGPVPAPMARRQGRFRAHLMLQAATREALHRTLHGLSYQLRQLPEAKRVRWSLDIDPVDTY